MYTNEIVIYPLIFTIVLFLINYINFHKKLNETNDLNKIIKMKIFVIVILLFVFTIEPSIYWAIINGQIEALDDIEISKQAILIFSSSQYLSIFLLLLVSYIAFKKIIEKIEEVKTDPKVISKYLTFTVLWLAIATMPIIWGLVYMFQQLSI